MRRVHSDVGPSDLRMAEMNSSAGSGKVQVLLQTLSGLQGHLPVTIFSGVKEAKPGRENVAGSIP